MPLIGSVQAVWFHLREELKWWAVLQDVCSHNENFPSGEQAFHKASSSWSCHLDKNMHSQYWLSFCLPSFFVQRLDEGTYSSIDVTNLLFFGSLELGLCRCYLVPYWCFVACLVGAALTVLILLWTIWLLHKRYRECLLNKQLNEWKSEWLSRQYIS